MCVCVCVCVGGGAGEGFKFFVASKFVALSVNIGSESSDLTRACYQGPTFTPASVTRIPPKALSRLGMNMWQ